MPDAPRTQPDLAVALETSTRHPSVAVATGDLVVSAALGAEERHASDLLPTLRELLLGLEREPREIDLVCVGVGPGSYTGLRVGVATALGLARGTGAAIVAVPSVAALAWAELEVGEQGTVLLDARSRELYTARYARDERGLVELVPAQVTRAEELVLAPEGPIFGDSTVARAARLDAAAEARLVTDRVPTAEAVLELALERHARQGASPPDEVAPLYLRPFKATTSG